MEQSKTVNPKVLPSTYIKELLEERNGLVKVAMLRGKPIRVSATKEGVVINSFMPITCEWRIFDALVAKAAELGGIMYRGDVSAQQGKLIGEEDFALDTMDAFISVNFYDNKPGNPTIRRSTYYAAILAWAKICTNNRSEGQGGYIKLYSAWLDKYSNPAN